MSPSDRATLIRKLGYLQGTLEKLKPYREKSEEDFLNDEMSRAVVERYLQTAIESVVNCSRLLVILKGWRRIREESEALSILPRYNIIPEDLASRLAQAKSFRNVLVHAYTEIDPQQVYRNLQEGWVDLEEFARAVAKYLKDHEE